MLESFSLEKFAEGIHGGALRLHDFQSAVVGDVVAQRFSHNYLLLYADECITVQQILYRWCRLLFSDSLPLDGGELERG
jgi:hypothetical protein